MPDDYHTVNLWEDDVHAHFTASFPTAFDNISAIAQAPDNTEVWIDNAHHTTIVIELNARPDAADDDEDADLAALRLHLDDITRSDVESGCTAEEVVGPARTREGIGEEHVTLTEVLRLRKGGEGVKVVIVAALVRYVAGEKNCDIFATFNVRPPGGGEEEELVRRAVGIRDRFVRTFTVLDDGLFDEE